MWVNTQTHSTMLVSLIKNSTVGVIGSNNNKVHHHKQRHSERGNKDAARRSRKVLERNGHSTARQAHSYPVRQSQVERSERISTTPYRNGTTQWIPLPDWSNRIGPVRMRPSKGTVKHFLFRCTRLDGYRTQVLA